MVRKKYNFIYVHESYGLSYTSFHETYKCSTTLFSNIVYRISFKLDKNVESMDKNLFRPPQVKYCF